MSQARTIFRKQSLDKLASPDRLDELVRVVRPQNWVLLGTLGGGLAAALLWSVLGRIPETASGKAVLVRPKQVVAFQSPTNGQIATIEVQVGDVVRKGDLLARMHLPTVENDLQLERSRLEHFRLRSSELSTLERDLARIERDQIREQRELIEERIASLRMTSEEYRVTTSTYLEEQRDNVTTARRLSQELGLALGERLQALLLLQADGVVSRDPVISAKTQVVENELTLANLDVRDQELVLQENAARETYRKDQDSIKALTIELSSLRLRESHVERRLKEDELGTQASVEEISRRIEHLEAVLLNDGHLFSQYDGRILEVSAAAGDLLARGHRIGRMEIEDPDAELMVLAYFQIGEGKKIRPNQRIRVSPSNVQRERFGGIVGQVIDVSGYPVTAEAAGNQIGDPTLARDLLGGTSRIGVLARLESAETPTGYRWTSGAGPETVVTPGTTAEARVTTDERAPITFVLPFLRSWTGV